MKKIMVLTSGGDASGMNAYIKALAKLCKKNDIELVASMYGYQGLVENSIKPLYYEYMGEIQNLGGTIIKTSRSKEFITEEGFNKALKNLKSQNIDCLVVVGGNGTFNGAKDLSSAGVKILAIPATIDNDLEYTDKTIGYDTACQNAVDVIVKIKQTMDALDRGTIVEVMGRHCSDIAVRSAILCGADILITENEDFEHILKKVNNVIDAKKRNPLIVVQENILDVNELAHFLEEKSGKEFRATVIGYLQRGGEPTANDKLLAIKFAVKTIECITKNISSQAIGTINDEIYLLDIEKAVQPKSKSNKLLNIYKSF
ncbi:MAG TPA: ATP-dependent 6-phosphofructokinase [Clostridiales bacterium]|nr:ATP-dependent 6-phosphofructokinase [Clostridiales bacterium]